MFRFLSKLSFFWLFYGVGEPKVLPASYTFSLSFKCNSRCLTCNIWQKKKGMELSREEWRKIFLSLGRSPYFVTFSGGEPFLRADLAEIVKDCYQICRPKVIVIPTNGLLTAKILKDARLIAKNCPDAQVNLNLSLDGIGEGHDQIRGIKGNFEKTMETFWGLKKIKAKNFSLGVHTVISRANAADFPRLCNFVLDELKPNSYIAEMAENRVELETMSKKITPKIQTYKKAVAYLKKKTLEQKPAGFSRLTRAFRSSYYDLAGKTMEKKTQIIPCYAGVASAQVAPNGDVWACCVRADILGNLKAEGYNFSKVWFSKKAEDVRRSIKNKECYCPLANASYTNILMSPGPMIKVFSNFLK